MMQSSDQVRKKITLIAYLLLSLSLFNCENFFSKLLGEDKSGRDTYFDSFLLQCITNPIPNLCDSSYWIDPNNKGTEYMVTLNDLNGQICSGINKRVYGISAANGLTLTQSIISVGVPLRCKGKVNDAYSWYKIRPDDRSNADLIFTHTTQLDSDGKVIIVDSFINYKSGDLLLCCSTSEITKKMCNVNFRETSCSILNVQ